MHHFKTESNTWHIFVDGAARNNPGPAGAGVYITQDGKIICQQGYYLGEKTNNQAEYLALLFALFIIEQEIKKNGISNPHVIISSDSELLVKQMNNEYRVKNPQLKEIKKIIDKLLQHKSYTVTHIIREKNKIADKLANKGIDSKKRPPRDLQEFLESNKITL